MFQICRFAGSLGAGRFIGGDRENIQFLSYRGGNKRPEGAPYFKSGSIS
jgi:hypothetical protein